MNISIPYHEIQDIIKKGKGIGLDISHIEHNVLGVDVQITQILADFIMALYRVRTKHRKCCNGVNIEPGMEVQVVPRSTTPFRSTTGSTSKTPSFVSSVFR